jgi:tripartite-type tricarboxylate transporter receptor subunit TctC
MNHDIRRRALLRGAAACAAGATFAPLALAQPSSPAKLLVGFPAGGPADTIARLLASLMAEASTRFIVENKPGATGQIAADAVRKSGADGSSLLVTPASILTMVPHLYSKPMYQSLQDFTTVGGICDHSFGLAVNAASPIRTVADYIQAAKAKPDDATYATAGAGSGMHLLGTLFSRETGVKLTHIPYRGTAPGLPDLMGGQVFSTFNPLPTMLELHRAGRIRIIAVSNPSRVTSLPDVPTFTELKLPALELVEWYGVFASAETQPRVLEDLRAQLSRALAKPELAAAARKLELEPRPVGGAELRKLLETDYQRMAKVVKSSGLSLD